VRRGAQAALVVAAVALMASAACSAILGLEPPPAPDAGDGSQMNDGPTPDAQADAPADAMADTSICRPLDASLDGSDATYYPLGQSVIDDAGNTSWEFFSTWIPSLGGDYSFSGTTFDGRYIYLASRSPAVVRYDTQGDAGFTSSDSWTRFKFASGSSLRPGAFMGAVFDGRFAYFVPSQDSTSSSGNVVRYDTEGSFADGGAWASFNAQQLGPGDGGGPTGFIGAAFDGRYVYFVPNGTGPDSNVVPDGRVLRYDSKISDAGFENPEFWSSFDLSTLNDGGTARGFYGAVYDGHYVYFAPHKNGAFDDRVNSGYGSIVARLDPDKGGFEDEGAWSTFDLTRVNGLAFDFAGAGFDGQYIYFAPQKSGVVVRVDTTLGFTNVAAWSGYDLTQVVHSEAAAVEYTSVTFDGRFVYFAPSGSDFGTVARYDTASTFTADCAWTTLDLMELDAGTPGSDGGPRRLAGYESIVFDGQYLYLIPYSNGIAARFRARSPGPLPLAPDGSPYFHGSFL
jgi:hypothetical protein